MCILQKTYIPAIVKKYLIPYSGIVLYILIQLYLRYNLDLRDYPGASGTLSVYRAVRSDQGSDVASRCFSWVLGYGFSLDSAVAIVSILSGAASILGIILYTWGLSNKNAATWAGIFTAVWTLSQYFGILTGVDSIAFGSAWLAVGSIVFGLRYMPYGILFFLFGGVLFPYAVGIKGIAMPMLVLLLPTIWVLGQKIYVERSKHRWNSPMWGIYAIGVGAGIYVAHSSYLENWPDSYAMVQQPHINWVSVRYGWFRIRELPFRGLVEGKFDQLCFLALLALCTSKKYLPAKLVLLLPLVFGLTLSAASLGEFIRPRYLAPLGMGLFVPIAMGMEDLRDRLQKHLPTIVSTISFRTKWNVHPIFSHMLPYSAIGIFTGLLLIDQLSYFQHWGNIRQEMVGGDKPSIIEMPTIWKNQYKKSTDITLRDLSLYGAIEFLDYWEDLSVNNNIAVPRLRDDRHRSIMAFAALHDAQFLLLDPGKCCAGTPVNDLCAQRIIKQTMDAGFTIILPTELSGIERVHANEIPWIKALHTALPSPNVEFFWSFQPSDTETPSDFIPCQQAVPWKDKK